MYVSVEFGMRIGLSPFGVPDDRLPSPDDNSDSKILKSQKTVKCRLQFRTVCFRKYDFDVDWSILFDYFSPVNESAAH